MQADHLVFTLQYINIQVFCNIFITFCKTRLDIPIEALLAYIKILRDITSSGKTREVVTVGGMSGGNGITEVVCTDQLGDRNTELWIRNQEKVFKSQFNFLHSAP